MWRGAVEHGYIGVYIEQGGVELGYIGVYIEQGAVEHGYIGAIPPTSHLLIRATPQKGQGLSTEGLLFSNQAYSFISRARNRYGGL